MANWTAPTTAWNSSYQVGPPAGNPPNELEDRRRHSQQAEQEGHHDQPEGPAAAEDSCAEQRDEGGDRHQESHFRRAVITRQQLQRLIVVLGCQNENGNQGDPGKREEAEDQPCDRLTTPLSSLACRCNGRS